MANNSFLVKGWLIAILVFAFGFLKEEITFLFGMALIISIIGLWVLDSHYLYLEREYRWKYDWVIENRIKGNDEYLFNLNPGLKEMRNSSNKNVTDFNGMFKTMFSWSVIYYLVSILLIVITIYIHV